MTTFKKLFVAAALITLMPSTGLCSEKDTKGNNINSLVLKNYFNTVSPIGLFALLSGSQTFAYAKLLTERGYKIEHPKMPRGFRNIPQLKTLGTLKMLVGTAAFLSPAILFHLEHPRKLENTDQSKL